MDRIVKVRWWILPRRFVAITIGSTVFVKESWWRETATEWDASRLLRHEEAHVKQWRRYGWLGFPLRYLWQWVRAGFRYHDIPFEREARDAESPF